MGRYDNVKGGVFERDVLPWLKVIFPRARRTGKGFAGSDYTETGDFCIEAKCRKDMRLGTWMNQVVLATKDELRKYPVVIHKRRGFGVYGAYVTMPLESWVEMIADIMGIEMPDDLRPVSGNTIPDMGDSDDE